MDISRNNQSHEYTNIADGDISHRHLGDDKYAIIVVYYEKLCHIAITSLFLCYIPIPLQSLRR